MARGGARPGAGRKPKPKPDTAPSEPLPARLDLSAFPEITDAYKRAYLCALATTPALGDAAALAGISAKTGYNYRHDQADTVFQAALQLALAIGNSRAEDEAWRRGIVGWREPVYQGGKLVGTKLVKSDTMLIFMLKGAKPEKYRERFEHSGPAGGPIPTQATYDLSKLSDAELVALDGLLSQAMAARVKEPVQIGSTGNSNGSHP